MPAITPTNPPLTAPDAPADQKSAEQKNAGQTPAEQKQGEQKPTEQKPPEPKIDRFHPEMPHIPGVTDGTGHRVSLQNFDKWRRPIQFGVMIGTAALFLVAILWFIKNRTAASVEHTASENALQQSASPELPPLPAVARTQDGPTVAATVAELSKPWAAKKFTFIKPFTTETVDAMVIRLPGGGLWAFALQEPYGKCNLDFVTDVGQIAAKYGYHASHPMVVNSCNNTVYDPLKVGPLGGSTWVRGEIVQGLGLRPPISIEVQTRGRSIVADRME